MTTRRTIIAIVGGSGAGKTHASLLMQRLTGWKTVVSYTTRRKREEETNGVEHWFVSKKKMPPKERMCAYTLFGSQHYWTTWEQVLCNLFPCIYVIDEKGLLDLKSRNFPVEVGLVTVKIERDERDGIDDERKKRDDDRITFPNEDYDFVVKNDGTLKEFEEKIKELCNQIENKIYGNK